MRRGPAPLEPKSGPLNGGTNLGQPKVRRSARIPTPRPANAARPATNSSRSAAREPSSEATHSRCSAAVVQLAALLGPRQAAAATIRPTATSQRRFVVGRATDYQDGEQQDALLHGMGVASGQR